MFDDPIAATAPPTVRLRAETPQDTAAIEALLDRSFGRDRQRKTSYRYRAQVGPVPSLTQVAEVGGQLVGSIRYWPVLIAREDAEDSALLLGPLGIAPNLQGRGIGRALVGHTLAQARDAGHRLVFLVGDPAYYGRLGFRPAGPRGYRMPGEDPGRLLWFDLAGDATIGGGVLVPCRPVDHG